MPPLTCCVVSKYQIVYFIASFAFVLQGFLDFFGTPGVRGLFFTFAGMFGLMAAWLEERDPELASLFGLLSAHFFMVEAVGLVVNRNEYSGRKLRHLIRTIDVCFVVATIMDVVLSYTDLLKNYNLKMAKGDVSAAALWLLCACFYVGATLYAQRKGFFSAEQQREEEEKVSVLKEGELAEKVEKEEDSAV